MDALVTPNTDIAELPQELLSVEQAADYAGVSTSTVRRWLKAGNLPFYRAGRQLRIDKRDLVNFLRISTG